MPSNASFVWWVVFFLRFKICSNHYSYLCDLQSTWIFPICAATFELLESKGGPHFNRTWIQLGWWDVFSIVVFVNTKWMRCFTNKIKGNWEVYDNDAVWITQIPTGCLAAPGLWRWTLKSIFCSGQNERTSWKVRLFPWLEFTFHWTCLRYRIDFSFSELQFNWSAYIRVFELKWQWDIQLWYIDLSFVSCKGWNLKEQIRFFSRLDVVCDEIIWVRLSPFMITLHRSHRIELSGYFPVISA